MDARKLTPFCIYDNPVTRRREGWSGGEVVWFITEALIETKAKYSGASFQRFREGRLHGDRAAIKE